MIRYRKLLPLLLIPLAIACSRLGPEPISQHDYLVSIEQVDVVTILQVKLAASFLGFEELQPFVTTDAIIYRIEYRTTYGGTPIIASGLIGIPGTVDAPLPLVSLHHGTLVKHSDAPSVTPTDYLLLTVLSTTGAISVIPDFAGFGSSTEVLHPYYIEEGEAVPVVDMLNAAREIMEDSMWVWNNKLLLTGYSEGGYVTMATHKYIEEHPETGYVVTASAPGSGGYDQVHMRDYFVGLESYEEPFYLGYSIQAQQMYFQLDEPLDLYFKQPYADRIPGLLNGSLSSDEINSELTTKLSDLLQPEFFNSSNNPSYENFESLIRENSLTDWTAKSPIRMYHGTADVTIPFDNSLKTYEKLLANGSNDITLVEIEGEDHRTAFIPMFKDMVLWFIEIKD